MAKPEKGGQAEAAEVSALTAEARRSLPEGWSVEDVVLFEALSRDAYRVVHHRVSSAPLHVRPSIAAAVIQFLVLVGFAEPAAFWGDIRHSIDAAVRERAKATSAGSA